jgi:GNAT superfamily N-acetyltransferase
LLLEQAVGVTVEVVAARVDDVPAVMSILSDAASWLKARGVIQWPERFPEDLLLATVSERDLYLVRRDGDIAGTVTLQWSDPMFWGDRADAGFIHRLAIKRSHAGVGKRVIAWAEDQVIGRGRQYLCLDTVSTNPTLRRYYEGLGFVAVGLVGGPAGHPHTEAHGRWEAVLYEKAVAASSGDRA